MFKKLFPVILLFSLQSGEAPAAYQQDADVGSTPEWNHFKQVGEAALRASLIDPDSAKIEWPYVARSGTLKALVGKRRSGFFTCGIVNAKNRMGGYTGAEPFLIMIRDDEVVSLSIGSPGDINAATATCPDFIKQGFFPLSSNNSPPNPTLGFLIAGVPEGASIAEVTPNGPAANVGLKPGMIVTAVNGVRLKGFDPAAIVRLIDATTGPITLSLIGHADIVVPSK